MFRPHKGGSRIWTMKNILYTIIFCFLFSFSALAEIYKWVDDEGNVHYGEKLPDNTKGKSIENEKTKDDSVIVDLHTGFEAYKKGDYATALEIYRAAAAQGNTLAQYKIGMLYRSPNKFRKLVTQNHKEAFKWFRLAAEHGEVVAQFTLGEIYRAGHGIKKKNLVIAHMWFNTAKFSKEYIEVLYASDIKYKELSEEDSMQYLEKMRKRWIWSTQRRIENIERKITPEQIAKAQKLARDCINQNYKFCG